MLESPQAKGLVLCVARVTTAGDLAWLETTHGEIYQLPDSLFGWAKTTVAVALGMANPFPSEVEFGVVGGRPYAQIL
jgi:hypothetical protein